MKNYQNNNSKEKLKTRFYSYFFSKRFSDFYSYVLNSFPIEFFFVFKTLYYNYYLVLSPIASHTFCVDDE